MDLLLTWAVFIFAFGGMVIIHELGHFIVARWAKIEVEEFGIGLPTPGALTFWAGKGYLILKNGKRLEIPANFKTPVLWSVLLDREVKFTVDISDDNYIIRSFEVIIEEHHRAASKPNGLEIYVDQNGNVVEPPMVTSHEVITGGTRAGSLTLTDFVKETHPGTRFTLNWLPLGGFVRPKGENDPEVPGGLAAANPWKRFFVLVAGPAMNLLTAVLIYSFIFYRVGVPDVSRVMVGGVVADSPAEEAGLQSGDIFVSGNGQPIGGFDDLRVIVDANADQPVLFVVERDNAEIELTATPKFFEDEDRVMIGVGLDVPYKRTGSLGETFTLGVSYTYQQASNLIALPGRWLRGMLSPEESRVIGLKGIFDIVGQTVSRDVEASQNLSASPQPSNDPLDQPVLTLGLIAALSISLGIFNLFPFPALDGGRIIFLLPELIFRRRVPANVENTVHALGMMILLAFMLYVNVMDFVKPANFTIP